MKIFDKDAKQMIRTYIDSIEEYFQDHTRLHPNEIDGLLNEINDFIYIRSSEISVNPKRVNYSEVLKAVEECGSPSEICGQYLEREKLSSENQSTLEQKNPAPQTGDKENSIGTKISHKQNKELDLSNTDSQFSEKNSQGSDRVYSLFSYSDKFVIYRLGFIIILGYLLIKLILYPFYDSYLWYDADYPSFDFYFSTTSIIIVFTVLEGIIINKWKDKLKIEFQLDRSIDDSLVSWCSHLSFMLIFLKFSTLNITVCLFFVPIWLGLFVFLEKKLNSSFWKEFLSPKLISAGERLSYSENHHSYTDYRQLFLWERIKSYFFLIETIISIILFIILGMTFFVDQFGLIYSMSQFYTLWTFFIIIAVIIPLILVGYRKAKKSLFINSSGYEFYYGKFGIIFWLIRLLTIKMILMHTTYKYLDSNLSFLYIIILLVLLITSEVIFETYGGDSLKFALGRIFVLLGSSSTITVKKRDKIIKSVDIHEQQVDNHQIQSTPSKTVSKDMNITDSKNITSSSNVQSIPNNSGKMTSLDVQIYEKKREPSILSTIVFRILNITFLMLQIFAMACTMLLISVYEVILAFIIIVTAESPNGSYQVPIFEFNIPNQIVELGGFIIWSWYALLLLGLQIFLVTLLQFYGLVSKKPEGIVVKIGRNLSRIFICLLIFFTSIQAMYNDPYAILRLMTLAFLLVFNELSAWKTHFERKRWFTLSSKDLLTSKQKDMSSKVQIKSS